MSAVLVTAESLSAAWQRYAEFFREVPHGTIQQLGALLELRRPKIEPIAIDASRLVQLEAIERRYQALKENGWCMNKINEHLWHVYRLPDSYPYTRGATAEEAIDAAIARLESK